MASLEDWNSTIELRPPNAGAKRAWQPLHRQETDETLDAPSCLGRESTLNNFRFLNTRPFPREAFHNPALFEDVTHPNLAGRAGNSSSSGSKSSITW